MSEECEIEEYDDPMYPELESVTNDLPRVKRTYARKHKVLGKCDGSFCNAAIESFSDTAEEYFYIGMFGFGGRVLYCSRECMVSDALERGFGCSDIQQAVKCERKTRNY